ncbi:hypothetical protein Hanom_Chr01g00036101 [Helianthus anomalus]
MQHTINFMENVTIFDDQHVWFGEQIRKRKFRQTQREKRSIIINQHPFLPMLLELQLSLPPKVLLEPIYNEEKLLFR